MIELIYMVYENNEFQLQVNSVSKFEGRNLFGVM